MGGIPSPDSFIKKNSAHFLQTHPTSQLSSEERDPRIYKNFVPEGELTELEYELLEVTSSNTTKIQL